MQTYTKKRTDFIMQTFYKFACFFLRSFICPVRFIRCQFIQLVILAGVQVTVAFQCMYYLRSYIGIQRLKDFIPFYLLSLAH